MQVITGVARQPTARGAAELMVLPVRVRGAVPPEALVSAGAMDPWIEIALPDGTLVRVGADVDAIVLRCALAVLRR